MSDTQGPSEEFQSTLCSNGGTPAAHCGCGVLWYGSGEFMDEGEIEGYLANPEAKQVEYDSVSPVHFRGTCWVYGCDCKVRAWLVSTEKWLIDRAKYVGSFYAAYAAKEQKRLDEIRAAMEKIAL